ncbi:two-component system, NtrC family, response regulator AtoC [Marinitoga hydrogenitolerans DSM 16785]|uniref:Two-component system, NtrC family, response regulator AtoC n=1 Tax=Marinitoga hydrogenitolerans (strain DSM 16785 / JCM 12826 / AT1271) TaxID=1122195 RepID=A0A1M4Z0Y5_MARH1|nr:sigma-54 dependent transcriptional regulator [Marinitoga hydrogenitolerans]SHF11477.1 two-component system, NtrC family, response regulator AtoC [Marinitoga hydrogenitolerans DSM 16785]
MRNILIIEDDKNSADILKRFLKEKGYEVRLCHDLKSSKKYDLNDYDILLLDMILPDGKGTDLIKEFIQVNPFLKVVVMTGFGDVQDAVYSMKSGAFDFIKKPIDLKRLFFIIEKAYDEIKLEKENSKLKYIVQESIKEDFVIGQSEIMRNLIEIVNKVIETDANLLITGETGVGKEVFTRYIQRFSKRKNKPFIIVNCAAIPKDLVESELFGYEKGAFTGAEKFKPGKFELADQGTIFLDEIGELPLEIQSKLLRVLESGTIERVGGTKEINVDVRVIAATNRTLEEEVKKGNFRMDLYYRLNVININIPPIRERKDDIPIFIEFFNKRYSKKYNKKEIKFSKDALDILMNYNWPGNIREIRNFVEKIFIIFDTNKIIKKSDISVFFINNNKKEDFEYSSMTLDEIEKKVILNTLKKYEGNKTKTAKALGISLRTLQYKLKKYEKLQGEI